MALPPQENVGSATVCVTMFCNCTENVARRKMASQSGLHSGGTADKAVDGINNPVMSGGSCAHPDTSGLSGEERNQPAWWRVDLGASYDIYKVLIVNRETQRGKLGCPSSTLACLLLTSKIIIFQDILK